MLLINDYTIMTRVVFLRHKSKPFEKFKAFKSLVENDTDLKIKFLRSNNGGEFTSNDFEEFCKTLGIRRRYSTAETPHQNGVVERKNIHVQGIARTMLNESRVSDNF